MADLDRFNEIYYGGEPRIRPLELLRHGALLLLAFVTMTVAGVLYPFGPIETLPTADPQTFQELVDFIVTIPQRYAGIVGGAVHQLLTNWETLQYGLSFSLSLLFILICHEMGHYIACRIYRVEATLPFFIPTPPLLGPAGTFGAFIQIRSPMPSRKAVFDIGVAGPIAGFIALLPIAVIAFMTIKTTSAPPVLAEGTIVFADPLLFQGLALVFGIDLHAATANAFYCAAWVGLLVTALNLIPAGQLDGGHAIYAVFGPRVHRWFGRTAFAVMVCLSVAGWFIYNSPSGFLIAVLLGIMVRVGHPEPYDQTPLDLKRKAVAALVLLIWAVSFLPFPIRIV